MKRELPISENSSECTELNDSNVIRNQNGQVWLKITEEFEMKIHYIEFVC